MKSVCVVIFSLCCVLRAAAAPPANDDFLSAEVIVGSSATASANNTDATAETGEPLHAARPPTDSVWWSWVSPVTGLVTFDTFGSGVDTLLALYTGSVVSALSPVVGGANDDDFPSVQSRVEVSVVSGVTYKIAVDSYSTGAITLNITGPALPPANDDFVNREAVTGFPVVVMGNTENGTGEGGEPDHAGELARSSVWWSWTASENEDVAVSTEGSSFDTVLAVYTGGVLTSLVSVASNDDDGTNLHSRVIFLASSGTTYQVAVDRVFGASNGMVTLSFDLAFPAPSNDDFSDRETVSGIPAMVTGNSVGASAEVNEPAHHSSAATESVWWTWVAPSSGNVEIDTFGSGYDTRLAIYTGTVLSNLTFVASNDDFGAGSQSKVSFVALGGVAYQIAVDGFESATGDITLNVSGGPAGPGNDNFVNAFTISGLPGMASGDNNNATAELNEPNHFTTISAQASAWWKWTAPSNGVVSIDTFGSSYDTLLGVYTGASVSTLTQVASGNKSSGTDQSRVGLKVQAGVTYYIAVDGQFGAEGSITLHIKPLDGGTITLFDVSGGNLEFTWKSESGEVYDLYQSTNLLDWASITNFTAVTNVSMVTIPMPPLLDVAYYRVEIDL